MDSDVISVRAYRVRRWTSWNWTYEAGDRAKLRREREDQLLRAAAIIERKLIDRYPQSEPSCKQVRRDGEPQLMFEATVRATDEDDARRRAMRQFERGLSVKIPSGGQRVVYSRYSARPRTVRNGSQLQPEWGHVEVRVV